MVNLAARTPRTVQLRWRNNNIIKPPRRRQEFLRRRKTHRHRQGILESRKAPTQIHIPRRGADLSAPQDLPIQQHVYGHRCHARVGHEVSCREVVSLARADGQELPELDVEVGGRQAVLDSEGVGGVVRVGFVYTVHVPWR